MAKQLEKLLEKLKNLNADLTREEMDTLVTMFKKDAEGEMKYLPELSYFHYVSTNYPDELYAHEAQMIRQSYIYRLKQDGTKNRSSLVALYVHSAEYYYGIEIYSESVRFLNAVLEMKELSPQALSVAMSILFSMLARNGRYRDCYPYIEKLKAEFAKNPPPAYARFVQEMTFMQIYALAGDTEIADGYYRKLKEEAPVTEGISPLVTQTLEMNRLSAEAVAKAGSAPTPEYIAQFRGVCSAMQSDNFLRDSNWTELLLPTLRYILPAISHCELIGYYDWFERFVYAPFDRLGLYTFLFEEVGVKASEAPDLYNRYIAHLKTYYKTNQKNFSLVISSELQAQELEREYRAKAMTDRLTKLGNRMAYTEWLQPLTETSEPLDPSLCLVMLDLDELKQQNDRFGHEAGDELLVAAAGAMQRAFGKDAELFRYGGDEFLVALTGNEAKIQGCLEKLQDACRKWSDGPKNRFRTELSMSSGYAFISEIRSDLRNEERLRELADLADHRMYEMKQKHHQTQA